VDAGYSNAKHWLLGALVAALASFAHARPAAVPHAGEGFHGGGPGAHARSYQDPRAGARYNAQNGRSAPGDRNVYAQRAPNMGYGGGYRTSGPNGMNGANGAIGASARMTPQSQDRSWQMGDSAHYAGAITQVSTDGHAAPHPPVNATMVRAGSIRADVTRYNEERGAARSIPRPPDDVPRPPAPSPYRN